MNILKIISKKILELINYPKLTKLYFASQYSSKQITKLQLNKLKKILEVAVSTVPYYQKLDLKIDFNNFSLTELKKFPIIDKSIIQINPNDFISLKYKHKGLKSHTSGSSGKPFEFLNPPNSDIIERIFVERAWSMGQKYHYLPKDPIIVLRSYSPKKNDPIYKWDKKNNYWYLSPFHINDANLKTYLNIIIKSKAKLLRGYPSSIYLFTLLLKKNNLRLPQIKTIITSSETLLPKYRLEIEQYWGIPVLDWYGQNERTITMQQCWAGNYHNNDEYGIIEIGENNHIIATSLNNYVMPFIRYDTKDISILPNKKINKCKCGRLLTSPLVGIEGRSDDLLIKKDGTKISTINIYTIMHKFEKIIQFKIIQQKDLSLLVYLVLSNNIDKKYLGDIKSDLIDRVGYLNIKFKIVKTIKRSKKTGKIKIIESKV